MSPSWDPGAGSDGEMSAVAQIVAVLKRLQYEPYDTRVTTVRSWDVGAIGPLLEILGSAESEVRPVASWALSLIGEPAVPGLLRLVNQKQEGVRDYAALALGRITDPRTLPVLLDLLHDESEAVRTTVSEQLAKFADPRVGEALLQALSDPFWEVRYNAVYGLRARREQRAIPAFLALLQDDSSEVRDAVTAALGELGDEHVLPALEWVAQHDDGVTQEGTLVKTGAELAIQEIQQRQARPGGQG